MLSLSQELILRDTAARHSGTCSPVGSSCLWGGDKGPWGLLQGLLRGKHLEMNVCTSKATLWGDVV